MMKLSKIRVDTELYTQFLYWDIAYILIYYANM